MRRLPVFLLLDTSGSMNGEPIEQVKNGVQMLVSALRQDPYALETAYLGVITFDSEAREAVPLTELAAFQVPPIAASGTTSLGAALSLVAETASKSLSKTTATSKGDWKPMVFIMTDGAPTDDWEQGFKRFQMVNWGIVVACAVNGGDIKTLQRIAGDAVVKLDTSDSSAMSKFFKWVSASVSNNSKAVETAGKEVEGINQLPPPPPEIQIVT